MWIFLILVAMIFIVCIYIYQKNKYDENGFDNKDRGRFRKKKTGDGSLSLRHINLDGAC